MTNNRYFRVTFGTNSIVTLLKSLWKYEQTTSYKRFAIEFNVTYMATWGERTYTVPWCQNKLQINQQICLSPIDCHLWISLFIEYDIILTIPIFCKCFACFSHNKFILYSPYRDMIPHNIQRDHEQHLSATVTLTFRM